MTTKDDRLKLQREALEKFKKLYSGPHDKGHVQEEMPRVSRSTLNALVKRGVLHATKGVFGEEGPDYYYWTEKEVE
jgi:hypothetical protein